MRDSDRTALSSGVIHRRRFLQGAGAVTGTLLVLGPAACGDDDDKVEQGAGTEPKELASIGLAVIPNSVNTWPHEMAVAKGWFAEQGLEAKELVRTYDQVEALLGGSVNLLSSGADELVAANIRGADLIVVGVMSNHPMQFFVVDSDVNSIEDLAGGIVGVTDQASSDYAIAYQLLADAGVDVSSIDFRRAGGSRDRFAALDSGQIDAAPLDPVATHRAVGAGKRVLATPTDFVEWPWNIFAVERGWAEENEDTVVAFLRAIDRSMEFLNDPGNDEAILADLAGVSESEPADIESALALVREHEVTMYDRLAPEASQLQPVVDLAREAGDIDGEVDLEKMVERKYWDSALG
jgi:NitT/TauT family transport system substrate-binding protein